jgi:hypothetical protein
MDLENAQTAAAEGGRRVLADTRNLCGGVRADTTAAEIPPGAFLTIRELILNRSFTGVSDLPLAVASGLP